MKWAKRIALTAPVISAICLFGAVNAMLGCYRQARATRFDASIIESVMNQPRPAKLAPGEPEPPRVFLDTTCVAPAGKTITGNFRLPNKNGSDWIVIRSSAADADLSPAGTRVTPAKSAFMPKLISRNSDPVVYTDEGAHHYRFIGVEIGVAEGKNIDNMVAFGADQTSLAKS